MIYVRDGQEETFNEFEGHVIPLMKKHNGDMILRIRPDEASIIEKSVQQPYEIHIMSFGSDEDLQAYLNDPDRQQYMNMKDQSIESSILIKGAKV